MAYARLAGWMVVKDCWPNPEGHQSDRHHQSPSGLLEIGLRMGTPRHPWFRRRGYSHFDQPVGLRQASRIVKDPHQVSQHSFYPFVEFTLQTFKLKQIPGTEKVRRVEKKRQIAYASHLDSHIYSYYRMRLSKLYDAEVLRSGLDECVLAFRALDKSNIDFAASAFEAIRKQGECYVLALDITGFFDNLDHNILKRLWARLLGATSLPEDHYTVFKSLTKYAKVELEALYKVLGYSLNNNRTVPSRICSADEFRRVVRSGHNLVNVNRGSKGIPQGSPLSALLSNMYMLEFDIVLNGYIKGLGGNYYRYCDDILVVLPPTDGVEEERFILAEISKLKLQIQPAKTDRVRFSYTIAGDLVGSKALQYLGFLFDGKNIILRSASLARYLQKMRRGVRVAKATMEKRNRARVARGELPQTIFKKTLYKRYSHLGRRNFLTYGYRAAEKMRSDAIRKQLGRLWKRLQGEIDA